MHSQQFLLSGCCDFVCTFKRRRHQSRWHAREPWYCAPAVFAGEPVQWCWRHGCSSSDGSCDPVVLAGQVCFKMLLQLMICFCCICCMSIVCCSSVSCKLRIAFRFVSLMKANHVCLVYVTVGLDADRWQQRQLMKPRLKPRRQRAKHLLTSAKLCAALWTLEPQQVRFFVCIINAIVSPLRFKKVFSGNMRSFAYRLGYGFVFCVHANVEIRGLASVHQRKQFSVLLASLSCKIWATACLWLFLLPHLMWLVAILFLERSWCSDAMALLKMQTAKRQSWSPRCMLSYQFLLVKSVKSLSWSVCKPCRVFALALTAACQQRLLPFPLVGVDIKETSLHCDLCSSYSIWWHRMKAEFMDVSWSAVFHTIWSIWLHAKMIMGSTVL